MAPHLRSGVLHLRGTAKATSARAPGEYSAGADPPDGDIWPLHKARLPQVQSRPCAGGGSRC